MRISNALRLIGNSSLRYAPVIVTAVWAAQSPTVQATVRAPLCKVEQARENPAESMEEGFRKQFCETAHSKSCDNRWSNARLFLDRALADTRIQDVGTIAYMFGTIYVETGTKDFSPAADETIWSGNKDKQYVKDGFYGRGWIQLTYRDKYVKAKKVIGGDPVNDPSIVKTPDNAYEILYRGMTEGWVENYRTSPGGAADPKYATPVRLSDFVTPVQVDYDHARAVINANCKKIKVGSSWVCSPPDVKVAEHHYIPPAASLDSSSAATGAADRMERLLCRAQAPQ
ncbi:hypothetical protein [Paraburkholderia fungorum]|uniref:hypothetical protein n=1 Tax=Paraburkholderia fungorum TaxID=134537 RepID=UPI0038B71C6D